MQARDDGRESVSRKAREVEPATVERNTHMVEVPLSNASTMCGCVEKNEVIVGDDGVVWRIIKSKGV